MIRLLMGEYRKLRTVWSTYVLFGVIVFIDLLFGLLIGFLSGKGGGQESLVPRGSGEWFRQIFQILGTAQTLALILGVLVVTGEYRHKTVTATYLVGPRRGHNIAAKFGISGVGGLLLGLLSALVGLLLGLIFTLARISSCTIVTGRGDRGFRLTEGSQAACAASGGVFFQANGRDMWHEFWLVAPGVVVAAILFGLFGVGLGALLKNQVVAIVVGIGFTIIVEPIIVAVLPSVGEYLPSQAATALQHPQGLVIRGSQLAHYLPWWGGIVMLLVYGVVLSVVGTMTTMNSDIT